MLAQITFKAPNRPMSINEANKLHWAKKRMRMSPWKETFRAAYRQQELSPADQPVIVFVSLPFERKARRDPHNYIGTVVKGLVDVLVNEGYLKDDTQEYLTVVDPELRITKDEMVHVLIFERQEVDYWRLAKGE